MTGLPRSPGGNSQGGKAPSEEVSMLAYLHPFHGGPVDPGYGQGTPMPPYPGGGPIIPPPPVVGGGPIITPPGPPPVAVPPIYLPPESDVPPGTVWPPIEYDEIWPAPPVAGHPLPPSGSPPTVGGGPAPGGPGRPTPPPRPEPGPPPHPGGGPVEPPAHVGGGPMPGHRGKAWVLAILAGPRGVHYKWACVELGAGHPDHSLPPVAEPK